MPPLPPVPPLPVPPVPDLETPVTPNSLSSSVTLVSESASPNFCSIFWNNRSKYPLNAPSAARVNTAGKP